VKLQAAGLPENTDKQACIFTLNSEIDIASWSSARPSWRTRSSRPPGRPATGGSSGPPSRGCRRSQLCWTGMALANVRSGPMVCTRGKMRRSASTTSCSSVRAWGRAAGEAACRAAAGTGRGKAPQATWLPRGRGRGRRRPMGAPLVAAPPQRPRGLRRRYPKTLTHEP
jgi:hypothetical protein